MVVLKLYNDYAHRLTEMLLLMLLLMMLHCIGNVSIVDTVVVKIDGDNVVNSVDVTEMLALWEDWSFEKTWLTDMWKSNY